MIPYKIRKALALLLVLLLSFSLLAGCGDDDDDDDDLFPKGTGNGKNTGTAGSKKYTVKQSAAASVTYESYNNGLFTAEIPKGWVVNVLETSDYIHYTFQIYDPKNPNLKVFFNMKTEGYFASQKDHDFYCTYYPTSELAKMPWVDPQTTEAFYNVFSNTLCVNDTNNFKFPRINGFNKIESLGKDALGAETLHATYTDEKGQTVEGVFYCAIMPVWLYYITCLNVYQAVFVTAPENELSNWIDVLSHVLGSIRFTQTYINNYYDEQAFQGRTAAQIGQICSQMTDIVVSGWEQRQATYDRISQKQSDATLGYERIYDTETKEIYEAPLDFFDYYKGDRYQTVTDDMYLLPIDGYIEWK